MKNNQHHLQILPMASTISYKIIYSVLKEQYDIYILLLFVVLITIKMFVDIMWETKFTVTQRLWAGVLSLLVGPL